MEFIIKPTKKEIKHMVLTEYEDYCCNCGKLAYLVDGVAESKK